MQTIVVTGASSGVGRALAVRAARAGMRVLGIGRDATRLAALAAEAAEHGWSLETLIADVGDSGSARRIVERAVERFGRIDVLVNNAGAVAPGALVEQSDAALSAQFAIHVVGPLGLVREALGTLQSSRGLVVMVGSGVGRIPVDGLGAYPAAKAALRSATTTLRRELKRYGIAVTYVDPGIVDTPFMERAGMAGGPKAIRVAPEVVARKIFDAIAIRAREVNAVPWQTAAVALGEHFPRITDLVIERSSHLVGIQPAAPTSQASPAASPAAEVPVQTQPVATADGEERDENDRPDTIDAALEAHARRMERSGLRFAFLRGLLVPDARLELGEVAMRWAGMPNRHERALTLEVLQALESAGYLEAAGDDAWRVLKSAD